MSLLTTWTKEYYNIIAFSQPCNVLNYHSKIILGNFFLHLYVGHVPKESGDAVVRLAVVGLELGDLQLFCNQVSVGPFVRVVEDRGNRAEPELLQNLRHEIRLHFDVEVVSIILHNFICKKGSNSICKNMQKQNL